MTYATAAFVGATGGAGTTRTTLEAAVVLAADGADVIVLDAAYATQGLGDYLSGRLDPDLTTLVTDRTDGPLDVGLVELDVDAPGEVACCPVDAPFERLARAKRVEAAQAFERRIEEAVAAADHVLVDVPPLAANQAVAATTACERVCLVSPGGDRGADATNRLRERVADVGATVDTVAVVEGSDERNAADILVPSTERPLPGALSDERYGRAVASLVSRLLDRDVTGVGGSGGLFSGVTERVRR
ncbi:cell division inhibitor [Salinigranum rubrum]|uniref:Cell division inhibitor n=1 Tax=Salinigranum rubrum TaxID=755307 RepID=A0A2I8VNI9_9EURY|nr:cell division inhibitor [Salinigranum rubrum]AUV83488.1 cell division inhibitor [Salinigranum rubrum]